MKAIRVHQFGDPEVMKLEEIPAPNPAAGQVLVRVKAAGVNPVDTYIRSGQYASLPDLPYTPGADSSGVVEKAGEGVDLKPGDRVYTGRPLTGTYAEFCLAEASQVHPLPENTPFDKGAGLTIPYATSYMALFLRGGARPGEWVLVHGASGAVGIAAVQWAHAAGMRVIGTAGTEKGRMLVADQGADVVLDHHDEAHTDAIMETTEGRGVDLILEMLANVNLGKDLPLLAKQGRVIVIGNRGTVEVNARDLMARDAGVRGIALAHATAEENRVAHAAIFTGLEKRALRPIINREMPLAEAPAAHKAVIESPAHGKIVLIP